MAIFTEDILGAPPTSEQLLTTPPSKTISNPDEAMLRVYNKLLDRGWEPHQAIGQVANMFHETAGTMDPSIEERNRPKGRGGVGLAQWTGPRRKALLQFATSQGLDPYDEDTQLAFWEHEMSGPEGRAGELLRGSRNVKEATKTVSEAFLRPGVVGMESRMKSARRLQAMLGHVDMEAFPTMAKSPTLGLLGFEGCQSGNGRALY